MQHVPFKHSKEITVPNKNNVIIDYDESAGEYVAFFSDSIVCRVRKSASFKSKGDLDHYLQQFCNDKTVQYGRIEFVMRVGRRIATRKEYSLDSWNPGTAYLDFMAHCERRHPKVYDNPKREIESSFGW